MRIIYFCFLIGLFACQESSKLTHKQVLSSESEKLFQAASSFSDDEKMSKILQKDSLDALKVYQKCIKNQLHFTMISRFIRGVFHQANQEFYAKNSLEWQLSRFPLVEFGQLLYSLKESHHRTFMDIGSGNGDKLYMAMCMGFEKAYGVEYEAKLHQVAEKALNSMIKAKLIELKQGDATKLTKEYFAQADFIYMYCPLILNLPEQAKLMQGLIQNIRDNTLIYEAGFVYAKELNQLIKTEIKDDYRGFLILKKEKGKLLYKTFIQEWKELK